MPDAQRLAFVALLLAGCGSSTTPPGVAYASPQLSRAVSQGFEKPALITLNLQNGALEYWPILPGGGNDPRSLSPSLGIFNGYALAANGDVIAIANYSPAEIVTYNVKTKAQSTLTDPYGGPIDIAVDKQATIYALNGDNVAVFKAGSSQPTELTCPFISAGVAIAVDNESDVFVNGYGPGGFMGVVKYSAGSTTCKRLHLRKERGYAGGVGIDPKTDDLIVIDNPDLCAGGLEGRMLIYKKPYRRTAVRWRNLDALYCAGTVRLNSSSTLIFVSDATISAGFPLIDQRTYPSAKGVGTYRSSPSGYSGSFGGFTTIPNTLPN